MGFWGAMLPALITGAGSLLGGKGEGPSREWEYNLSPEQMKMMQALFGFITPQIGQPTGVGPIGDFMMPRLREMAEGWSPGRQKESEEFYQTAIRAPAKRTFQTETLPSIEEAFVGPGTFWGSPRAGAVREAHEEFEAGQSGQRGAIMEMERQRAYEQSMGALTMLRSMLEYELPQFNPILEVAMAFIDQTHQQQVITPYEQDEWARVLQSMMPGIGQALPNIFPSIFG